MALGSSALFLGAVLLPWVSLVSVALVGGLAFPVFGAQASLWDLAGPFAPIDLPPWFPLVAGVLMLVAALAVLVRNRLGAALGLTGVLVFLGGTADTFGVHAVGSALTFVAAGPGIVWAVAGVSTAAFSYRSDAFPIGDLVHGLRSSRVLARLGLFIVVVFLAIDAADHALGGNPLALFGTGPEEFGFHSLFVGAVATLAAAYLVQRARFDSRAGSLLIVLAGIGLLLDAIYHATRGDVIELVGHTGSEMIVHTATYYGIALLTISRFVLRSA